ncbi:MAG TPA: hypothetical protein DDW68_10255 [Verrucomicrobiales bacterium]|nr:hypothetical protein [Verrucomicrobiales bacterium]
MISRAILCLTALICGTSAGQKLLQGRDPFGARAEKKIGTLKIPKSDPAGTDIMRFDNGDLIHGKFGGLDDRVLWIRPDIDRLLRVKRDGIRQIVFNSGRPGIHSSKTSHVSLINGDQIPGKIKSLTDKHLILDSPVLGELKIPREQLKSLCPNPFNGKLAYAGPFTSDDWVLLTYPKVEKKKNEEQKEKVDQKEEEEAEVELPNWVYSGAAFFNARDQAPLVRKTDLPDTGRLQFEVSWKGRLNLNIAVHADFIRPIIPEIDGGEEEEGEEAAPSEDDDESPEKKKDEEEETKEDDSGDPAPKHEILWDLKEGNALQSIPWLQRDNTGHSYTFGSSYVLNLSSYSSLYRCEFDDNGKAQIVRLDGPRVSQSLSETGTATVDLRFDRRKRFFILYINGNYAAQWTDPQAFEEKGTSMGFSSSGNCKVRLSNIYVTSWNGLRDSALSMEHEERDVALLINGTDRFSGSLTKIDQDTAHLKTAYAEMTIPVSDISSLELKKSTMADIENEKYLWEDDSPSILLFKPLGRLSLTPKGSSDKTLEGHSPFLGNLKVNLDSATLLRFNDESFDVTDWFNDL